MKRLAILGAILAVFLATFVAADPVLSSVNDETIAEGQALTIQFTSTPEDNGTLIMTLNNKPSNAVFTHISNSTTATLTWTPSFGDAGVYNLQINASDDNSSTVDDFVITVVPPINVADTVNFGSDSQRRSNPNHDKKASREVNVTEVVEITNNGASTLTDLSAVVTGVSKYTLDLLTPSIEFGSTTLAPGAKTTATLTFRVPENLDAVDANLEEVAFQVANIEWSGTINGQPVTSHTDVNMQAENMLRLDDVDVEYGDDESESLDNGDDIRDVKPGDILEFIIEVENDFSDKEDVDMEDVEVIIEVDDLDIDEDLDYGDMHAGDKDIETVDAEVEDDVDGDDYDGTISLSADDEFGAAHGELIEFTVEVDRKSHEIDIRSMTLTPDTVTCQTSAELRIRIRNIGNRDEDEVFVHVQSEGALVFNEVSREYNNFDRDDDATITFTVPVPSNTPQGSYRIFAETFYDVNEESNQDAIFLTKAACIEESIVTPPTPSTTPDDSEEPEEIEVIVIPGNDAQDVTPTGSVVAQPEPQAESFTSSGVYLALIGLLYLVVIVLAAVLAIKLLRK